MSAMGLPTLTGRACVWLDFRWRNTCKTWPARSPARDSTTTSSDGLRSSDLKVGTVAGQLHTETPFIPLENSVKSHQSFSLFRFLIYEILLGRVCVCVCDCSCSPVVDDELTGTPAHSEWWAIRFNSILIRSTETPKPDNVITGYYSHR